MRGAGCVGGGVHGVCGAGRYRGPTVLPAAPPAPAAAPPNTGTKHPPSRPPAGMPALIAHLGDGGNYPNYEGTVSLATAGSNMLEFGALALRSGRAKYLVKAERGMRRLHRCNPQQARRAAGRVGLGRSVVVVGLRVGGVAGQGVLAPPAASHAPLLRTPVVGAAAAAEPSEPSARRCALTAPPPAAAPAAGSAEQDHRPGQRAAHGAGVLGGRGSGFLL